MTEEVLDVPAVFCTIRWPLLQAMVRWTKQTAGQTHSSTRRR